MLPQQGWVELYPRYEIQHKTHQSRRQTDAGFLRGDDVPVLRQARDEAPVLRQSQHETPSSADKPGSAWHTWLSKTIEAQSDHIKAQLEKS